MKPGNLVLVLLLLALVAVPLAPAGDSTGSASQDPAGAGAGMGYSYRYGNGAGMPGHYGMQGSGPMPPAGRQGHERAAQSEAQAELRRDPFDWNGPVRTIRFHGFRRLSGKNILEHEKRLQIYSTILMNPGIDVPTLASYTGINLHTLRYHVSYLVRMKKIACIEQGGGHHFFENHGRFDHAGQQEILFQRYPTTHRILAAVDAFPGITRGGIADQLGIAGPSVTRWMQRLLAESVITEVREGRYVRYYPARSPVSVL